jgi:hypothetical protein
VTAATAAYVLVWVPSWFCGWNRQWATPAVKGVGTKKGDASKALSRAYERGHIMPDDRSGHVSYASRQVGSGSKRSNTEAEAAMHPKPVISPVTNFLFMLLVRARHNLSSEWNGRASMSPTGAQ